MPVEISIELYPNQAADEHQLKIAIAQKLNVKIEKVGEFRIIRKSIDARKAKIKVNIGVRVFDLGEQIDSDAPIFNYRDVRNSKPIVIVGFWVFRIRGVITSGV